MSGWRWHANIFGAGFACALILFPIICQHQIHHPPVAFHALLLIVKLQIGVIDLVGYFCHFAFILILVGMVGLQIF